jgi:hypothetical protein
VALHNDRLQGEALPRLIGKADLQPYAVAATVGSRGCNRSWRRLQPYVLLLLGAVPTAAAVYLLCRVVLTMPCSTCYAV